MQELLATLPERWGAGFRLVRREWSTNIGPVDLMCRDADDGWVVVEITRMWTIDALGQLSRYLERLRMDPALADRGGVLAAQAVKGAGARAGQSARAALVGVDVAEPRGEREPALRLFGA